MQRKLLGIISVDATGQYHVFCILQILEKKWKYDEAVKKAIPLQAWTGPEDSRKLRLPDFKTIGT